MYKAKLYHPETGASRMQKGTIYIDAFIKRGWVIMDDPDNRLPHGYANETKIIPDAVPEEPKGQEPPQVEQAETKGRRGRPRGSKNGRRP